MYLKNVEDSNKACLERPHKKIWKSLSGAAARTGRLKK